MEVLNEGGLVKLWSDGVKIEDQAREQLKRVARLPFIHRQVAAMPDCHFGKGATIGSVIPTIDAIVPAAVGVDIGCGIAGWKTDFVLDGYYHERWRSDLSRLRNMLERAVPHGRTNNGQKGDRGAWGTIPMDVAKAWGELADDFEDVKRAAPPVRNANILQHLGTLGTGNHFIEYATDESGQVWILLHSGSRGVGAAIAGFWMKEAQRLAKQWHIPLEDRDLAYLPRGTEQFDGYLKGMFWGQRFAAINRRLMLENAREVLQEFADEPIEVVQKIETPHNFAARERHFGQDVWVTRKGACKAEKGDLVVIPGSMGERSFIVEGKGNRESLNSCSHGAGRAMSRRQAFKTFDLEHHVRATAHVECRKDKDVLDETVGCYKPIDDVIAAQSDLISVVHELRAFVNVKG